jgi:hypothetical protein
MDPSGKSSTIQNFLFALMLTIRSVSKKTIRPSLFEPIAVLVAFILWYLAPTSMTGRPEHSRQPPKDSTFLGREADSLIIRKVSTNLFEARCDGNPRPDSSAEIGTFYRRTKNGWEDARKWQNRSEPIEKQIDGLHPFTLTLLVLGLVLLVLLGCSRQSEIDRLFADLDSYFGRENRRP